MAIRKPKTEKPDSKRGRAREMGRTVTFTFEMDPDLSQALEDCAKAESRTKRAIIVLALKKYMGDAGFWAK